VEGGAVLVLFGCAQWLEARSTASARSAISAVLSLKPARALLADAGAARPPFLVSLPPVLHAFH
jgi:cation transport ATPase